MNVAPIKPHMQFDLEKVEQEMRAGYRMEAEPMASFFRVRFFNEVDSVMLLASRENLRQIHAEIGRALDLASDRKARRRRQRQRPK